MAKSIKCSDAGVDCAWSATATNEEELMKKVQEHALSVHGFTQIPPEHLAKVKSIIREV